MCILENKSLKVHWLSTWQHYKIIRIPKTLLKTELIRCPAYFLCQILWNLSYRSLKNKSGAVFHAIHTITWLWQMSYVFVGRTRKSNQTHTWWLCFLYLLKTVDTVVSVPTNEYPMEYCIALSCPWETAKGPERKRRLVFFNMNDLLNRQRQARTKVNYKTESRVGVS